MVKHLSRYRLLHGAFIALFVVFAVGVPVVIASCPMMKAGASTPLSCCAERSEGSLPSLSAYKNTSCCVTTIVASRNTQEFIPHSGDTHLLSITDVLADALTLCHPVPAVSGSRASFGPDRFPPGTHPPLHLLNSSLLI